MWNDNSFSNNQTIFVRMEFIKFSLCTKGDDLTLLIL